jgi:integrase
LAKTLTAAAVAKLLPGHKRLEVPDAGCPGLRLVIQPSGAKSWALRFRRPDGRTGKLTVGRFDPLGELEGEPVVGGPLTLAAARRLASDIMRQRALGKDVISDYNTAKRRRRADYEQRAAQGFGSSARRFIEQYAKPKTRSWTTTARLLGLKPSTLEPMTDGLAQRWRDKLVSEITPDDVHDLVDEVRSKGVPGLRQRTAMSDSTARVALLRLNKFFSWAVQSRLATANPCSQVWRPAAGPARERVLSDDEIKWLWRAAGDLGVGSPFGAALRLLLLLGQRRGEVGGMRWDELDGGTWTLPGARTKNGRVHVVPLSHQARDLIADVHVIGGPFVFTSDGSTHAAGWSRIKRRLDARMSELARAEKADSVIPPWVTHDLRRTCATGLQKLGVRLEVTEATLNHVSGTRAGIVGVYQRHQYADEKREALNKWAAHVEKIVSGQVTAAPRRVLDIAVK